MNLVALYTLYVLRHVWTPEAGGCNWCFSVARDVFAVVRDFRMWCPHDIGRDSWVWGEQDTLWSMIPPTKWGKNPSPKGSPCREETGWPVGKMIVVVVVVVVVVLVFLSLHRLLFGFQVISPGPFSLQFQ